MMISWRKILLEKLVWLVGIYLLLSCTRDDSIKDKVIDTTIIISSNNFKQVQFINDVINDYPKEAENYFLRSRLHAEAYRINQALRDINTAIQYESKNGKYHFQKAKVLLVRNEYDLAMEAANQALSLKYKDVELEELMGVLYHFLGDDVAALTYLKNIHNILPEKVSVLFDIGKIYNKQNDTIKARQYFDHILTLKPGHVATYIELGKLYNQNNLFDIALTYIDSAYQKMPQELTICINMATTLEKMNNIDSAYYWYNKSIEIDSTYLPALYKVTRYQLDHYQYYRGKHNLEKLLRNDPQVENGYYRLGYIYEFYLKDLDKAQEAYINALKRDSTELVLEANTRIIQKIAYRDNPPTEPEIRFDSVPIPEIKIKIPEIKIKKRIKLKL